MKTSNTCVQCGKHGVPLSVRFCPQCGHPLFVDLSRNDLTQDMFLDTLSSVYNLIITTEHNLRDIYFHPVSRRLIEKRHELEHREEFQGLMFGGYSAAGFPGFLEAIGMRISARSSNWISGYAVRTSEELIVKRKSPPLPLKAIQEGIALVKTQHKDEYIIRRIALNMSDAAEQERILFIFYLQDDNKHMNYFLDKAMLSKNFDSMLRANVEATLQRYRDSFSITQGRMTLGKDEIAEEALNDIVFGYCVRLSESLFPVGSEAPSEKVPVSAGQENLASPESESLTDEHPTKEELFRRIDEVEKNLEQGVTGAPPPDLRRLAAESETSSMMSSIGPYALGADIGSLQGLVELTSLEYLAIPKEFPGESIFKGPPVDFLGRTWEIWIGSIEGCVYKIQAQITSDDPTVVSEAITTTFRYCKERLGWPTKQKQVRLNTMNIWSMEEGNVILGTGGGIGPFRFVNLALTSAVVVRSKSVAKKKSFLRRIWG